MSGPWLNYQPQAAPDAGPWTKYGAAPTSSAAPAQKEEPGFLDKDIPLSGPLYNPTLSGIQSIGRGVRSAVNGVAALPGAAVNDVATGHIPLIHELGEGIRSTARQIPEIPGAIHDINQSPDPLGSYAKVAQDTAGEGAGQALTALAGEGAGRLVPNIASAAKPVIGKGLRVASDIVDPDITGIVSPRLAHVQRLAGRIGSAMEPKPVYPGAHLPEAPPTYPGAPLPEHPGVFPGAHLPENPGVFPGAPLPEHPGIFPGAPEPATPAPEVLQANSLLRGPQRIADPAAALERIPAPGQAGSMASSVEAPAVPPAKLAPPNPARVGDLLNEGLGGKIPEGHTPVKSTAIRSYKYDPTTREFEATTATGTYIHGDVSPEQVAAFEKAPSKGKAWSELKNNSTYVGKIVNGERVSAKPPRDLGSATPDDLTPVLQRSLDAAKKARAARIAKPN